MLENGGDGAERKIDLATKQIDDGWPATAIRHRDDVDASLLSKLFAAEMDRRAEAGGRHAECAGLRLGERNKLFDVADWKRFRDDQQQRAPRQQGHRREILLGVIWQFG